MQSLWLEKISGYVGKREEIENSNLIPVGSPVG
jgi:hypothetical protein